MSSCRSTPTHIEFAIIRYLQTINVKIKFYCPIVITKGIGYNDNKSKGKEEMSMETKTKRTRRSREEIVANKIASNEEKIQSYREKIRALEQENEELRNPKVTMDDVVRIIKEKNLSLDDVMRSISRMSGRKTDDNTGR